MKKITYLIVGLLIAVNFTSCKKANSADSNVSIDPNKGNTTPEYNISYKLDGVTVTETEVAATRGTTTSPRTLTITGTVKNGAVPKFKFYTEETFIGFVQGLNVRSSYVSPTSNYIEYTNSSNVLYSTKTDKNGIYLFISDISYTNGGFVKGTFSGSIQTANGITSQITEGTYNVKFSN